MFKNSSRPSSKPSSTPDLSSDLGPSIACLRMTFLRASFITVMKVSSPKFLPRILDVTFFICRKLIPLRNVSSRPPLPIAESPDVSKPVMTPAVSADPNAALCASSFTRSASQPSSQDPSSAWCFAVRVELSDWKTAP